MIVDSRKKKHGRNPNLTHVIISLIYEHIEIKLKNHKINIKQLGMLFVCGVSGNN